MEIQEEAKERKIKEKYPSLSPYFDRIKNFRPLVKKMEKVISKEGYILDTASERLWALRKRIKFLQDRIGRELEDMLNSSRLAPPGQDLYPEKRTVCHSFEKSISQCLMADYYGSTVLLNQLRF